MIMGESWPWTFTGGFLVFAVAVAAMLLSVVMIRGAYWLGSCPPRRWCSSANCPTASTYGIGRCTSGSVRSELACRPGRCWQSGWR